MNFKIAFVASAVMALAGALSLAGCAGTECDKAVDHVAECFPDSGSASASGSAAEVECTGTVECQAKCTSAASCDTLTGKDLKGAADYAKCVTDCAATK